MHPKRTISTDKRVQDGKAETDGKELSEGKKWAKVKSKNMFRLKGFAKCLENEIMANVSLVL